MADLCDATFSKLFGTCHFTDLNFTLYNPSRLHLPNLSYRHPQHQINVALLALTTPKQWSKCG